MANIDAPPAKPEWWLFFKPGQRKLGHMCRGQTAAVAGSKARAVFRVHWSQLEVEYLGPNPIPEPCWTANEEDLYQHRVERARAGMMRELAEKARKGKRQ